VWFNRHVSSGRASFVATAGRRRLSGGAGEMFSLGGTDAGLLNSVKMLPDGCGCGGGGGALLRGSKTRAAGPPGRAGRTLPFPPAPPTSGPSYTSRHTVLSAKPSGVLPDSLDLDKAGITFAL